MLTSALVARIKLVNPTSDAIQHGADGLFHSTGGAPHESYDLANYLARLDPAERRTVAYEGNDPSVGSAFSSATRLS